MEHVCYFSLLYDIYKSRQQAVEVLIQVADWYFKKYPVVLNSFNPL